MGAPSSSGPPQGPPEPFPGYTTATIDEIEAAIAAKPEGAAREQLKAAIRTAERADGKPRQGVLDATEPAPPPAPPALEPGDSSGRPPLGDVAAERAADAERRTRVITTTAEETDAP